MRSNLTRLVLFLFFLAKTIHTQAQFTQACPNPLPSAANSCNNSCVRCDIDGLSGRLAAPAAVVQTLCGNAIPLENAAWYGFVAGSSSLSLRITASNCDGVNGIQAAVVQGCNTSIACQAGTINSANQSITLNASGLVPGSPYQLAIDGYNGAVCNYSVSILSGSTDLPITVLPDLMVCPEELPYQWNNSFLTVINFPGVYEFTSQPIPSQYGCDSMFKQKVIVRPIPLSGYQEHKLYNTECVTVGGQTFCEPGLYDAYMDNAFGCDSLVNVFIEKIYVKAVIPQPDTLTCSQRKVVLKSTGSTDAQGMVYSWMNQAGVTISSDPSVEIYASGTYTLIIGQPYGGRICYDTTSTFVHSTIQYPHANAGPMRAITCANSQLQIAATASSGPNYSYLWIPTMGGNIVSGANTLSPIVNAFGIYNLYVTDNLNGCTASSGTLIFGNVSAPSAFAEGGVLDCNNTSIQLNGTTNIDLDKAIFKWTGPDGFTSNESNPTVSTSGNYTLKVQDGENGCASSITVEVEGDATPPEVSIFSNPITCTTPNPILKAVSSRPNSTFQWNGPDNFTSNLSEMTVVKAGEYTITVTGDNACTTVRTYNVLDNTTAPTVSLNASDNLNCTASSVNLVATASGGNNLGFTWTSPTGATTSTGNNPFLSVNESGLYSLKVVNPANGCENTANIVVASFLPVEAAATVIRQVFCNGNSTGTVTVSASGGNAQFSYNWSNGATSQLISGLTAGVYEVTVTDSDGCSSTAQANVTQPSTSVSIQTAAVGQSLLGIPNGSVQAQGVGGVPPYSYLWSNGATSSSVQNLMPNTYSVQVTDANGCAESASATVNSVNCSINVSPLEKNITCNGLNNGQAVVVVNGGVSPLAYDWSTGSTAPELNNLAPGNYQVTVTDAANCPAQLSFSISEPQILDANAIATPALGENIADGTATSLPIGGSNAYTYLWSTGATTHLIEQLLPGSYTVTVSDSNGCTHQQTVVVESQGCNISVDQFSSQPVCHGGTDGQLGVVVSGGISPTFLWSTGDVAPAVSGVKAGEYAVTISDINGCQEIKSFTIGEPTEISITISSTGNTQCQDEAIGFATVSASGGSGQLNYLWNNGQTGTTASDLLPGVYSVEASDVFNCKNTQTVEIISVDVQAPVIVPLQPVVGLEPNGRVDLSLENTQITVTDNCAVAFATFSPATFDCGQQGTHVVTITATDISGNSSSTQITVIISDLTSPTMTCSPSIIRCFGDGVVTYPAPVAGDNCPISAGTFEFTGLNSGSTFPVGVTTNTFKFTDAAGNVGSCTFEVTVLSELQISLGTVTNDIGNQSNGSVLLNVSGSLAPYNFEWKKDGIVVSTSQNLTNVGAGQYTVEVTDAFGCTKPSLTATVDNLVGSEEPVWAAQFSIQPNPSTGLLTAKFPSDLSGDVRFEIYDATGRRLKDMGHVVAENIRLDLTDLPSGLYAILVSFNGQVMSRKIVVEK